MRRSTVVPPRRRPEGIRWLRSDGKPNFSDRIHRHEGEAKLLAKRPVYTTTRTSTILRLLEDMTRYNVRAMPVIVPNKETLEGMVTVMDAVSYLGGGELYDIVVKRHGRNIYAALLKEYVSSIMNPNPVYVTVDDKLTKILEVMVTRNVGVLPVLYHDGTIWGIITEHDIVGYLAEKTVGRRVSEVMTTNVITISVDATLKEAMETMIKYGVRRLPIVADNSVWGMITAKDIVRFFGSHEVFTFVETGNVEEALATPVKIVGVNDYVTISPDADVGEAAKLMIDKGVSSLLVVEEGKLTGIITERDILYALAIAPS
ncbi:CBS domain-containing protein [Hyperthermus butylicus]|nr:CBS domain-containing protein [Hyperthermus butylicus]